MRQGLCRRQLAGVAQPEGAVALAVVLFAAAVGAVEVREGAAQRVPLTWRCHVEATAAVWGQFA